MGFNPLEKLGELARGGGFKTQEPGESPGQVLANMPGRTLYNFLHLLQSPQAGVQTGIGNLTGGGGQQGFRERRENIANALDRIPHGLLGPLPLGTTFRVATELGTDPLSYVGFGIPAKLAALAQSRNLSPAIIQALTRASQGEQFVQSALMAPWQAIGGATKYGLSRVPLHRQVVETPAGQVPQTRQSTDLWDFLTAQSRETALKLYARFLADANRYLQEHQGTDLGRAIALGQREIPGYQGNPAEMMKTLEATERSLLKGIQGLWGPRAKLAALDILADAESRIARTWEEAAMAFDNAMQANPALANDPNALGALQQQTYQRAFDGSMRVLYAAHDTILNQSDFLARAKADTLPAPVAASIGRSVESGVQYVQAEIAKRNALIQGTQYFDPLFNAATFQQVNPRIGKNLQNLVDRIQNNAIPVGAPGAAPNPTRDQLLAALSARLDQLGTSGPTPGYVMALPNELRRNLALDLPMFEKYVKAVIRAQDRIQKAFATAYKNATGKPMPDILPQDPIGQIQTLLQQMGYRGVPIKSTADLITQRPLLGFLPTTEHQSLERAIRAWPGGDILTESPFNLALDRAVRDKAQTLGITNQSQVGKILSEVLDLYKAQALLSPNYPAQNILGILFQGGLRGVNPLRVLDEFRQNVGVLKTGGQAQVGVAKRLNEAWGYTPGEATRQSFVSQESALARQLSKSGLTAPERIGAVPLAAGGGLLGSIGGFMSAPRDADPGERFASTLTGGVTGATGGAIMPWVSKKVLRDLTANVETVGRQVMSSVAAQQAITQEAPLLRQLVNTALATPVQNVRFTRTLKRPVQSTTVPQNALAVQQAIEQSIQVGHYIRPDELERVLRFAGADNNLAAAARRQWSEAVQRASAVGDAAANEVHFDYQNLTNFEQFLKSVVPFSTWAAKAFPFYAEELAKHPGLIQALHDLSAESDRIKKDRNLSNRFAGALPGPEIVSSVFSRLIGHQVEPFFDPVRNLFPFSGASRKFGQGSDDDPIQARILNTLSALGPTIRPDLELLLRTSGFLGGDEPARGYLRWSPVIQAITSNAGINRGRGIDIERPVTSAEETVRRVGGQDPTNIRESQIMRRIDELALRETGKPINAGDPATGPYILAKSQQRGAIWDRAAIDVTREKSAQSLTSFGASSLSPQAMLGSDEAAIRAAQQQRIVPQHLSDRLRRAAESSPTMLADPGLIEEVRAAATEAANRFSNGVMPPQAERILQDAPTAKNLQAILSQITEAQAIVENPAHRGYATGGTPQEQKLSALLAEYNNIGALTADSKMTPEQQRSLATAQSALSAPILQSRRGGGAATATGIQMRDLANRKEALRSMNPLLDQYLNYQAYKKGQGNFSDFFKNFYQKQLLPRVNE